MGLRIREEDVHWRQVGDEVVILDLRTSQYFSLNGTGALLWPLLSGGATAAELATELATAFDLDAETAQRDVEAFLAALRERDLLDA